MDIEVTRGYVPGAIGRIVELNGTYYHRQAGFGLFFEAKMARELMEFLSRYDERRDGLWLAVADGRVEGSIAIDGFRAGDEGAQLRWFIVSDRLRGRGAGSALLAAAMEFCRDKGYAHVRLWTFAGLHAARHLYEKHGFRLTEETRGARWGSEVNEQRFDWSPSIQEKRPAETHEEPVVQTTALGNVRSITAYDRLDRVGEYDADMQLLHPNRSKMIDVVLRALPLDPRAPLRGLDLGAGTGYFTRRFLEEFPRAHVTAIDGAPVMIEQAGERLADLGQRVAFQVGDLRCLGSLLKGCQDFDIVFSSYALHHLDAAEKAVLVRDALSHLRDTGWFVNADLLACDSPDLEPALRSIKIEGIVARANGLDERFIDKTSTQRFLQDFGAEQKDQPLALSEELEVLKSAGLEQPTVLWLEYDEAVIVGRKGHGEPAHQGRPTP